MPKLTLLRFNGGAQEHLQDFRSLRETLRYRFPEDPYPEDAMFFMAMRGSAPVARAAIVPNPLMPPETALLGFFEAKNEPEAVSLLFDAMSEYSDKLGKKRLIGPINGSTWQTYRVALPVGEPFFLDVVSQPYYQMLFEENGFATLADYFSSKSDLDADAFPKWEEHHRLFTEQGFSIQTLNPAEAEAQLHEIYALSTVGFQNNFLYTPISEELFMKKYLPLLTNADPRFIYLLRDGDNRLAGYHFAIRNILCQNHLELVHKTIALSPELKGRGLGGYLMENCRRDAWHNGYCAVYHALMHIDNISAKFNMGRQREIRRYKLYCKYIS